MVTMKRNKQIDVKSALALAGTFNFLCCCARACLLPFFTLYLRQLGLTPAMTGIIMGTKHLITLVWSPAASLLSKHYNKRRAVITGSLVCSAAVALLLLLIPPAHAHRQTGACNESDPGAGHQSLHGNMFPSSIGPAVSLTRPHLKIQTASVSRSGVPVPAKTDPDSRSTPGGMNRRNDHKPGPQPSQESVSGSVNDSFGETKIGGSGAGPVRKERSMSGSGEQKRKEVKKGGGFDFLGRLNAMDTQHQLFFLILFSVSVWEIMSAPLDWTADDGLFEYLDYADASDRYSGNGLWDSLGAACGVGGAGLLVSQLSCVTAGQNPRSAVHFYCYAGVAALALPVAVFLPLHLSKTRDRANGLLKAVQLVRSSPRALLCAVTTMLVGLVGSSVDNFLLWHMEDRGSGELDMSLSLALALLSQAAFPLLAGRLSKLLSPGRVLAAGVASLALQCFYYSLLWGPWAVLPAQVLSSFSRGALWWAVAVQCEDVATPGAERSVRRMYSAVSVQLGEGLGSFAGGLLAQRLGLMWLFRGAAAVLLLWCVCLLLLQWKAPRQRRINYSRLLAADASEASDSESEAERDWLDKALEDDRSINNYGRRINR